jgi:hypothetical protein
MKTLYYVLVLFIISTVYLFSQSEENEIIEMYTLTNANTLVATETDTTIVSEPVNEQEEQTDLSKYNFYNDYLADLQKTSFIHSDDTLAVNDCKKTGIISAKGGITIADGTVVSAISVAWDIPISCKINFATKYFYGEYGNIMDAGGEAFSGFGLGVGYVSKRTNNIILRHNIYIALLNLHHKGFYLGINIGTDVILWKVFSVGMDASVFNGHFYLFPTVGLNIVY